MAYDSIDATEENPRRTLTQTLRHRWYITVGGLICTAAIAVAAMTLWPAKYQASASVLLLPPTDKDTVNPLLGLGGLQPVTDVIARALNDDTTANQLGALGFNGSFAVTRDPNTSGPVIAITVTGSSAAESARELNAVVALVPDRIKKVQDDALVPATTTARLTSSVITLDALGKITIKQQLRAALVAVALGLLLTIITATLFEGLSNRRNRPGTPKLAKTPARPGDGTDPPVTVDNTLDGVDLSRSDVLLDDSTDVFSMTGLDAGATQRSNG